MHPRNSRRDIDILGNTNYIVCLYFVVFTFWLVHVLVHFSLGVLQISISNKDIQRTIKSDVTASQMRVRQSHVLDNGKAPCCIPRLGFTFMPF